MKPRTLLTTAALFAAALFILDVPAAMATTYYVVADGNWSGAVWGENCDDTTPTADNPSPGVNDEVRVCSGCELTITDSRSTGYVTLVAGTAEDLTKIIISTGGTLTLSGTATSTINAHAVIELTTSTSVLANSDSHTITGAGDIDGEDDDAEISIANNVTLTSEVNITGNLAITGAGNFTNEGLVRADNANGTLSLEITGTLDDKDASHLTRWQVNTANAVLAFNRTATTLDGRFVVSAGTLDFNYAVTSEGRLELSGGTVQVDANVTLGDQTDSEFILYTGGTINVAAGCTFTHN